MRTLLAATALATLSATATLAMDRADVRAALIDMGYSSVEVIDSADTVTFAAQAPSAARTIVYDAQTGLILSDNTLSNVQDTARVFVPSEENDVDEASETVYDTDAEDTDLGVALDEGAGIHPDDA